MQDGVIVENAAKNDGSLRTIPLVPLAVEALKSLPQPLDRDQLVFPGVQGGTIDLAGFRRRPKGKTSRGGPWARALAAAGLDYRPPKHRRHTFATLALSGGVRIEAVSRMLGHKDVTTTARYYARWTEKGNDRIVEELAATMPDSLRPKPSTEQTGEAEAQ
jgi:integrase